MQAQPIIEKSQLGPEAFAKLDQVYATYYMVWA